MPGHHPDPQSDSFSEARLSFSQITGVLAADYNCTTQGCITALANTGQQKPLLQTQDKLSSANVASQLTTGLAYTSTVNASQFNSASFQSWSSVPIDVDAECTCQQTSQHQTPFPAIQPKTSPNKYLWNKWTTLPLESYTPSF